MEDTGSRAAGPWIVGINYLLTPGAVVFTKALNARLERRSSCHQLLGLCIGSDEEQPKNGLLPQNSVGFPVKQRLFRRF
jgi:hypothetical protein